jgi:hypothetical protein
LGKREETIVEPGVRGGWNEEWSEKAKVLIELGRSSARAQWSAERREHIFRQVLARVDKARERRRLFQAFAAGASTVVLVGLLLGLIGLASPAQGRRPELAGTIAIQRLAAD